MSTPYYIRPNNQTLFSRQPPFHLGRHTRCQRVIGNIGGDHRASRNHTTLANGDTRTHNDAPTQPGIIADADRIRGFLRQTSLQIIHRMLRRVQLTVGPNEHMTAQPHVGPIQDSAIVIEKRMLAYRDTAAMVAMKGRTDGGALRDAGDELFDNITITLVGERHGLQLATQLFGLRKTGRNLRVCKGIPLLCTHLFKFSLLLNG